MLQKDGGRINAVQKHNHFVILTCPLSEEQFYLAFTCIHVSTVCELDVH